MSIQADEFLPSPLDFSAVHKNLVVIVSRMLTQYIDGLSVVVTQHIPHKYSAEMANKSEVIMLDVLM